MRKVGKVANTTRKGVWGLVNTSKIYLHEIAKELLKIKMVVKKRQCHCTDRI